MQNTPLGRPGSPFEHYIIDKDLINLLKHLFIGIPTPTHICSSCFILKRYITILKVKRNDEAEKKQSFIKLIENFSTSKQ